MNEREYRHPEWQALRLKVFERDGFECARCGSKEKELHAHHKRYKKGKKLWQQPIDDIVTLCVECHDLITEQKEFAGEILSGEFSEPLERFLTLLEEGYIEELSWLMESAVMNRHFTGNLSLVSEMSKLIDLAFRRKRES